MLGFKRPSQQLESEGTQKAGLYSGVSTAIASFDMSAPNYLPLWYSFVLMLRLSLYPGGELSLTRYDSTENMPSGVHSLVELQIQTDLVV